MSNQSVAVEFKCNAPTAEQVFLAGSFNDWESDQTLMAKDKKGIWRTDLELHPGRHEFKFVVDGEWCCEPNCHASGECPDCVSNEFGTMNRFVDVE